MNPLRSLLVAAGALLVVLALLFGLRRVDSSIEPRTQRGPPAVLEALRAPGIDAADGTRVLVESQESTAGAQEDDPDCHGSPIDGFRNYAADFMALDESGRARKLEEPATALVALSREGRARLGLGGSVKIETESKDWGDAEFRLVVEPKASYELIEHWSACARAQGLDLTGELLAFLNGVTLSPLESSEANALELACRGLRNQFDDPVDARRIGAALLVLLHDIQSPEPDWDVIDPVVDAAANASWGNTGLRESLLELLDEPWLADSVNGATFLTMLVGKSTYAEWQEPLDRILRSNASRTIKWGCIEVLRTLTVRETGSSQGVSPEELDAAIPSEVLRSPYKPLRWAAFELLAGWGGEVGHSRLLAELEVESNPDRAGVLGFLALKGRADLGLCERYLADDDPLLRDGAAGALATLAKSDDQAFERLRDLALNDSDPLMRLRALQNLGETGRPDALEALVLASRDSSPEVQLAAVEQLGLWGSADTLRDVALDGSRAPKARETAFQEWLKDAPDTEIPDISERMYRDGQADIQAEGYLMKAMLALGSEDSDSIATWESLPVPSGVFAMGSLLSADAADSTMGRMAVDLFDGSIRDIIRSEISGRLSELRSPETRKQIAQHQDLMDALPSLAGRPDLSKQYEVQARILRYLDKFAPGQ